MEPPAGAAPAGLLYKRNPQAAAWRRGGRHANASQSRVLPSAQLAYETGLSAGSIAVLADGENCARPPETGALTRSCTELDRLPSERITDNALRAIEDWRP